VPPPAWQWKFIRILFTTVAEDRQNHRHAASAGECQGLAEELEEARKASAETERERDEAAARGDELALQLADVTAARDALTCVSPWSTGCSGLNRSC